MTKRLPAILLCAALLLLAVYGPALAAYKSTTLQNGDQGDEVARLQQALIDLGYLSGTADGKFGNKTENALRTFQRKNGLAVDGLAGDKTRELLYAKQAAKVGTSVTPAPTPTATPTSEKTGTATGNLFNGNYTAMRVGSKGDRVTILQQALIRLKLLSGKADGKYGSKTKKAVIAFQKQQKLSADGVAGKKTLLALEKAILKQAESSETSTVTPTPTPTSSAVPTPAPTATPTPTPKTGYAPDGSKLVLLHWFNDIKGTLKNGDHLLIYEPTSGISWTLRVYSRGRHCDSEPLTAQDTENMVKAFGGKNTWNQKGVYVRLPSGVWTIGSTHDMPHMSGSIKNNNFNGHLCVHFLRDMSECKKNDPNYGVSNQETIRALWKQLTGETIGY